MKISDLKEVNKLKYNYDIAKCLVNSVRYEYIRAISYDSHRSYDLPNDPRLKEAIDSALASYMYEIKCDLINLGVEVDE